MTPHPHYSPYRDPFFWAVAIFVVVGFAWLVFGGSQ